MVEARGDEAGETVELHSRGPNSPELDDETAHCRGLRNLMEVLLREWSWASSTGAWTAVVLSRRSLWWPMTTSHCLP